MNFSIAFHLVIFFFLLLWFALSRARLTATMLAVLFCWWILDLEGYRGIVDPPLFSFLLFAILDLRVWKKAFWKFSAIDCGLATLTIAGLFFLMQSRDTLPLKLGLTAFLVYRFVHARSFSKKGLTIFGAGITTGLCFILCCMFFYGLDAFNNRTFISGLFHSAPEIMGMRLLFILVLSLGNRATRLAPLALLNGFLILLILALTGQYLPLYVAAFFFGLSAIPQRYREAHILVPACLTIIGLCHLHFATAVLKTNAVYSIAHTKNFLVSAPFWSWIGVTLRNAGLLGWGPDWILSYGSRAAHAITARQFPTNDVLLFFFEHGLMGLGLIVTLLALVFKKIREQYGTYCFVVFAIMALVTHPFHDLASVSAFMIVASLYMAEQKKTKLIPDLSDYDPHIARAGIGLSAIFALFIFANVGIASVRFALGPKKQLATHRQYKVPSFFVKQLLLQEDVAFFKHHGINTRALERSLILNLQRGGYTSGASTISMQYAKNLYLGKEKTFSRKIQQITLAMFLEWRYSKSELLKNYLDVVDFGITEPGLFAATRFYFHKTPENLTREESYFLIQTLINPQRYNPNQPLSETQWGKISWVESAYASRGYTFNPVLASLDWVLR